MKTTLCENGTQIYFFCKIFLMLMMWWKTHENNSFPGLAHRLIDFLLQFYPHALFRTCERPYKTRGEVCGNVGCHVGRDKVGEFRNFSECPVLSSLPLRLAVWQLPMARWVHSWTLSLLQKSNSCNMSSNMCISEFVRLLKGGIKITPLSWIHSLSSIIPLHFNRARSSQKLLKWMVQLPHAQDFCI